MWVSHDVNQDTTPRATTDAVTRRNLIKAVGGIGAFATLGVGATASAAAASRTSSDIIVNSNHVTTLHHYDSGTPGPTTLVIGGMHGDEQSGYTAADEIASWAVDSGELYVIPRLNAVAVDRATRECDHGDLNRAFPPTGGDCDHWLAERIWDLIRGIDPDWTFDLHASYGIWSEDTGVGQAMFPTMTDPARNFGENTVAALNDEFGLTGDIAYTMGNTLDADRPMLLHRITGVWDRPGFICETYRGNDTPLDTQVAWHTFCVEHVMGQYGQTAIRNPGSTTSDPTWEAWPITVDDPWKSYDLHFEYTNPVVIAKSITENGTHPAHVRLRNISGTSFGARVEEWDYLNGAHLLEETGMLTIEAGVHTYEDGTKVEAGRVKTGGDWKRVGFDHAFAEPPVVLGQSQTVNGPEAVVTRVAGVTTDAFGVRLQEQEAGTSSGHRDEAVGYVAIEQGSGMLGPKPYETGVVRADDGWTDLAFDGSYAAPVFLCGMQSYQGPDPAGVRVRNLSGGGVSVRVEEGQSGDLETAHATEEIGYLVMED